MKDEDGENGKDPICQGIERAVEIVHWTEDAPAEALVLRYLLKEVRRVTALEDGEKEIGDGIERVYCDADVDDPSLPSLNYYSQEEASQREFEEDSGAYVERDFDYDILQYHQSLH